MNKLSVMYSMSHYFSKLPNSSVLSVVPGRKMKLYVFRNMQIVILACTAGKDNPDLIQINTSLLDRFSSYRLGKPEIVIIKRPGLH